ncbi:MAG: hypothetical protein AAGJ70_12460, partial [Pseudomonadota bacterium]
MKHHQRRTHLGDTIDQVLPANVLKKLPLDRKRPPGQRHLGNALGFYLFQLGTKILRDVHHVGWRTDRCNSFELRHITSSGKDRRATKAVADKKLWRLMMLT